MKLKILVPALLLCLFLSGCGEVLAGSYQASSPHVDRPATAEDSSAIRVESYRELVSAVLYLVAQGEAEGIIQLYDYPGDVEAAVTAACLEVATQDPLGAYCVDYIRHETTRVVSYDQAAISIHYRRTMDQVRSIVNVTGTSAIRTELQEALSSFANEVVLRVAYFSEDTDSITQLIRQAYYDNPGSALGFPRVEINLYPDSGSQRVVEILLTYPESAEDLRRKKETLAEAVGQVTLPGPTQVPAMQASAAAGVLEGLLEVSSYDPEGGATPYDALVDGGANSEGMTLAYVLLCQEIRLPCELVEGALLVTPLPEEPIDPEATPPGPVTRPWFWVSLRRSDGETLYLDPSAQEPVLCTAQELFDKGYRWSGGPQEQETETQLHEEAKMREDAE